MFDYIIVGGGSAGCALAGRLSEDPQISVCLLEAGGSDHSVFTRVPLGFAATAPLGINSWDYHTVPQAGFNGRKGFQPRGKIMGGSSSINAMVYTRGNPKDYDHWAALGNAGWSYQDVLPLFKRAENCECFGQSEFRGSGGPLNVAFLRSPSPLNEAFFQACEQNGVPHNADYNAGSQFGVSPAQVTQKNGERWNAARAYLWSQTVRPNLTVIQKAHIHKVLLEDKVAVGIEYEKDGQIHHIKARKEVVLSAGAYGSPKILMLSGVGPARHLEQHAIPVIHDLPGVGQNLQDHLTTVLIYRTKQKAVTLGVSLRGAWTLFKSVFQWRRARTGWLTTNVAEAQGFISTQDNHTHPDIQLALCTGIVDDHTRKPHWGHGYTLHVTLMRPKSRGRVELRSKDAADAPLIDPAFLSEPHDLQTLMQGVQRAHTIMGAAPLAQFGGKMLYPLDQGDPKQMERFLRKNSDTEYHPVGTCKMGPVSDAMAVVDAQLRVHGIARLRVVDASIMPTLISGNTNAPTIMIAENAAQMMRAQREHDMNPMGDKTVPDMAWNKLVCAGFDHLGLDGATLCREAGIDTAVTENQGNSALSDALGLAFELAVQRTGDPTVGLRMARHPLSSLGVLSHIVLSSPTAQQSLKWVAQYLPLFWPMARVELQTLPDRGVLVLSFESGKRGIPSALYDFFITMMLTGFRIVLGKRANVLKLHHPGAVPADLSAWTEVFGEGLVFNATHCAIELCSTSVQLPVPTANPAILELAERIAAQIASRQNGVTSDRVRKKLLDCLPRGEPRREQVAEQLGLSERSLCRRLSQEGTTFVKLLDGIRREMAELYIQQGGYRPTEITFALGFSDPSNFYRAYKRWFGRSPVLVR